MTALSPSIEKNKRASRGYAQLAHFYEERRFPVPGKSNHHASRDTSFGQILRAFAGVSSITIAQTLAGRS